MKKKAISLTRLNPEFNVEISKFSESWFIGIKIPSFTSLESSKSFIETGFVVFGLVAVSVEFRTSF